MSFGTSSFGTAPFGGTALESGGMTLTEALPQAGATGVPPTNNVAFEVNAPANFDELTLSVRFNGTPVISAGSFTPGYGGTINFNNDVLIVIVTTHPTFQDGAPLLVEIEAVDLAATPGSVSYTFHVAGSVVQPTETMTLSEGLTLGVAVQLSETLTLSEEISPLVANINETLTLSEALTTQIAGQAPVVEVLTLNESLQIGALFFETVTPTTLRVAFPEEMALEEAADSANYRLLALASAAFIAIAKAEPSTDVLQTGTQGQVVETTRGDFSSYVFETVTGNFLPSDVGRYLFITGSGQTSISSSPLDAYRIVDVDGSRVVLERPLSTGDPANGTYVAGTGFVAGTGTLQWALRSGARGALLTVTEATGGQEYLGEVSGLRKRQGGYYSGSRAFVATATRPKLVAVTFLPADAVVLVAFDEPMRVDAALLDPNEYAITGPAEVTIRKVVSVDPKTVALETSGFTAGSYQLTVNATGTPKDLAGNPIDPTFNQAIFTAFQPITNRSVFTDRGPLTKPPRILQSGTGGSIPTFTVPAFGTRVFTSTDVVLPGAALTSSHVGLYVEIGNSSVNGGSFKIRSVITPTRARLEASLVLPDPSNGTLIWRLIDPRTGEIADDPSDVTVRVNGMVTSVQAVVGLLGQIVLPAAPAPTDDVQVDYHWVSNPTVEFRRLNSKEFRLNGTIDAGPTQHGYRFKSTLVQPSTFEPDDIRADLVQPLLRELNYLGFERAYSVALNDPNLLVLNTPIHKIAYPPLTRPIESTNVSYTADVLPENDTPAWARKGVGVASIGSGSLVVQDNTDGPFPSGNPLFWTQGIDLTYSHVFAVTWRLRINSTVPVGVFTGVSVGWSDGEGRALLLGYLLDGGVRKVGFLRRGMGANPAPIEAWIGGLSTTGDATEAPVDFDWSINHSYRLFRGLDGVIRLFVDGEIVETLRVLEDELPFLEELNDPFDQLQGVFFGSLSREAENVSTWDFFRYLVLPTNPEQTTPSIFVSYEGNEVPESATPPWIPVGYHGNETILADSLLLDSTSATTHSTSDSVGLVGGDFRGYTRIEPLLEVSSDVVLDFGVTLRTFTHGVTPNAVMAAIDDGDRLIQLSFLPRVAQPKVSYPGRSLPSDATPQAWSSLGGAPVEMVGRTLRINDNTGADGRVFFVEDLAPMGSPDRIVESTNDYFIEFKLKIVSFQDDATPARFCGVSVDVFDGTRSLGLMTRTSNTNVPQFAFHSDGTVLQSFDFPWDDQEEHVVRIVKSTIGDLVSVFVDNVLLGTFVYSSFQNGVGNPTISFGSSTASSSGSQSVVEWSYVNVWRGQPATMGHYVGIWKGTDPNALTGYYLPVKVVGSGPVVGNVLTDPTGDFVTRGVIAGDPLVIDVGPNKGVFTIASVSPTALTLGVPFPSAPSQVSYRIPRETDFTVDHTYRILRDPGGSVTVFLDGTATPLLQLDYNEVVLPSSSVGIPAQLNRRLPSITWGAFDPTNLSQTEWDFVRFGVTRSPSESRIVPHHQVLNQRNVMASPEHLFTSVPHGHTQYSSASTGIPYPWKEFVENPAVHAFTKLNEGTPLVPQTQSYEVRRPTPTFTFVSGLNNPTDVLGDLSFLTNDGTQRVDLIVPDDVLYNCLEITERTEGEPDHITPISDDGGLIAIENLAWDREVCATYRADVLPENDQNFGTPWVLESEDPGSVSTSVFSSILTYGTGYDDGNTIYRNLTPLTDPLALQTRVEFRLRVANDSTSGLGDTGIRCGFNALGMTAALAFVSDAMGGREVRLLDLLSGEVLAALPFDFLDNAFHVYRLEKNVADATLDFTIDP